MSALKLIANAVRRMDRMFPGYFAAAKHNHYSDFGYPTEITFDLAYAMFNRNGLARAVVDKTVAKTWQDNPWIQEFQRDNGEPKPETPLEKDLRTRFADLRLWQRVAEADRRSMVGSYSGLILRFADNQAFDQPVTRVPGGLDGLVEVIPAWEGQLQVADWHTDERSPDYGTPRSFQFNEASVGGQRQQQRQFQLHPDRVIVWSTDGTVHGRSALEPGFNDLMTLEKISGAGGEGFWKNAKSSPIIEVGTDANIETMARTMGVPAEAIADKMDEQVGDWQKGFDKLLMLQGMEAKTLGITLPSPEHFFAIALQSFAASFSIPLKILVGSQSGERASTEDAQEWARTNMGRRNGHVIPGVMELVNRLERFGILPERDWHLDWSDLTESTLTEKIARADKMADVNQKMKDTGEFVFTPEEIREVVGFEPLADDEKFRDKTTADDEADALDVPKPDPKADPADAA